METIIQIHNQALKDKNYTGVVTRFSGYLQFGQINGEAHDLIGFTADLIRSCVEMLSNPDYAYARQKNGYINLYKKDNASPTGVSLLGGIPNELEFLLKAFKHTGQLSPTEDLRTAH